MGFAKMIFWENKTKITRVIFFFLHISRSQKRISIKHVHSCVRQTNSYKFTQFNFHMYTPSSLYFLYFLFFNCPYNIYFVCVFPLSSSFFFFLHITKEIPRRGSYGLVAIIKGDKILIGIEINSKSMYDWHLEPAIGKLDSIVSKSPKWLRR